MEVSGIVSVGSITVICYLIAQAVKMTPLDNRWLPVICLTAGGFLGVLGMHIMVDYPANDILTAIAVGIVSGGAATGINQVYKQMSHDGEDKSK